LERVDNLPLGQRGRVFVNRGAARAAAWLFRLGLSLFAFVGALQLMKTGAERFEILEQGSFLVENAASTLGLGWLGALCVLSGSPIAASALALVAAGEHAAAGAAGISEVQGFTMLTGSRLGAAFVVLATAVVYALRGGSGHRWVPVSTAVIALSATAMIYVPAAFLGFALIKWDRFRELEPSLPGEFMSVLDLVYGGLIARTGSVPALVVFAAGLAILLIAFKLIDTLLPRLDEDAISSSRRAWLERKWPMFGLGCVVALVTMSVSVALTVLVPLVARGWVKRDHVIPYVMGANITTLGDTMFAAFALNSPAAVRIVTAQILATTVVSLVLLAFFYPQSKRGIWWFQRQFMHSRLRLALFTAGLFVVPVSIILVAGLVA
jgi:hypothetical protein